jgi:putative SOS response-associated peptidase YedK
LLECYPADEMVAEPVGTHVNNVRNNDESCITPAEHEMF